MLALYDICAGDSHRLLKKLVLVNVILIKEIAITLIRLQLHLRTG